MPGIEKTRLVDVSDEISDEFTCGICQDIFVEPVVTPCCRQIFCKECVYQWLDTNNICPNDRKSLAVKELTTPSRLVTNLLNKMKVKCDYHSKGCEIIVSLEELTRHIQFCDLNPNRICKNCCFKIDGIEEHNCIKNLLKINETINNENKILKEEITELKANIENIGNGHLTRKDMESCIEAARNCIDDMVVTFNKNINARDQQICIDISKHALVHFNTYGTILTYLYKYWEDNYPARRWNAIIFAEFGGNSVLNHNFQFLQLRFGKLFIEFFTPI